MLCVLNTSSFLLFLSVLKFVIGERGYIPNDDTTYLDPNNYIKSGAQNQYVQEVLRKYSQDGHHATNNPLSSLNKDLLASTPDPRYYDSSRSPEQNFKSRPYGDDRIDASNVGLPGSRYRNQNYGSGYAADRNRNRYDVYPDGGRADPPRQYFENDPQYALREDEILKILSQVDVSASQQCNINVRAQWDFETNVNDVSQIRAVSRFFFYLKVLLTYTCTCYTYLHFFSYLF